MSCEFAFCHGLNKQKEPKELEINNGVSGHLGQQSWMKEGLNPQDEGGECLQTLPETHFPSLGGELS